jgi:NADPH2:quinone reductase
MKAIRVHETGGPEMLKLDELPNPTPGPGELLVDVEAVGVNFIEIYQREGQYPMRRPFTPGAEAAGVVRAVGANVTDFQAGDRVVSQRVKGAYAECALAPAEFAVRIPEGISSKVAAAIALQGVTAHYLATSTFPLAPGHKALVHAAAGGVGLLLCQIAKKRGAFVIGTASTDAKRKLAREAGADEMIDYTTEDFAATTRRITGNVGEHVVYDSVGKATFDKSVDSLAKRGMMVLFGQSSGAVPPFDPQILNPTGSLFLTRPTANDYVATREELLGRLNDLFAWVRSGELAVRIGAEFPLEKAGDAQVALASRQTTGKVLLVPSGK